MGSAAVMDRLEAVRRDFALEVGQRGRYAAAVARWPNISDDEYFLILPTIWVNGWFDQVELCRMPYRDFLRTRYWRVIASHAKKVTPYCQQCFEYLQELHAHHKTYVRRGLEWVFPSDLIVLCHSCHKESHKRMS